jgi:hypothetical protein
MENIRIKMLTESRSLFYNHMHTFSFAPMGLVVANCCFNAVVARGLESQAIQTLLIM